MKKSTHSTLAHQARVMPRKRGKTRPVVTSDDEDREWRPSDDDASNEEIYEHSDEDSEEEYVEESSEEEERPASAATRKKIRIAADSDDEEEGEERDTTSQQPRRRYTRTAAASSAPSSNKLHATTTAASEDDDEEEDDDKDAAPAARSRRKSERARGKRRVGERDLDDSDEGSEDEADAAARRQDDEDERWVEAQRRSGDEACDEITGEKLAAKHVVWRSPDKSQCLRFNLSTLRKVAARAGEWRSPPHFRSALDASMRAQIERKFGERALMPVWSTGARGTSSQGGIGSSQDPDMSFFERLAEWRVERSSIPPTRAGSAAATRLLTRAGSAATRLPTSAHVYSFHVSQGKPPALRRAQPLRVPGVPAVDADVQSGRGQPRA